MSNYLRQKVLRIPVTQEEEKAILIKYGVNDLNDLEYSDNLKDVFSFGTVKHFAVAPTISTYIDYILEDDFDNAFGDWGKNRELYESEKQKYGPMFLNVYEGFDINKIRLVEYCWYNCCEAPDYYDQDPKLDSFYEEV